jgi:hypothetical protein
VFKFNKPSRDPEHLAEVQTGNSIGIIGKCREQGRKTSLGNLEHPAPIFFDRFFPTEVGSPRAKERAKVRGSPQNLEVFPKGEITGEPGPDPILDFGKVFKASGNNNALARLKLKASQERSLLKNGENQRKHLKTG